MHPLRNYSYTEEWHTLALQQSNYSQGLPNYISREDIKLICFCKILAIKDSLYFTILDHSTQST